MTPTIIISLKFVAMKALKVDCNVPRPQFLNFKEFVKNKILQPNLSGFSLRLLVAGERCNIK